jgi:acyl-coenzyme A synthetase/AMP-(fatty) acid ligase
MPNCIETLEALLATASIGAIWSCSSPDFGSAVRIIVSIRFLLFFFKF